MIARADDSKEKVRLNISSTLAFQDNSLVFEEKEEIRRQLKLATPQAKAAISHHLRLSVSGPMDQVQILGSFASDHPFIGGAHLKKIPQWDKKPYAFGSSSQGHEMSVPIHIATIDDLRKLLAAAKEQGVEFKAGDERTVIDKATEIFQDLGLSR